MNYPVTFKKQYVQFVHIGLVLTVYLLLSMLVQSLSITLASLLKPNFWYHPWLYYAVCYLPLYCLVFPVGMLWLRLRTVTPTPKRKMRFPTFLKCVCACFSVMYAGNMIGTRLNEFIGQLRGEQPHNALNDLVQYTSIPSILVFVVILAPIMEELFFRKFLLDALHPFGEWVSVAVGGAVFGLVHGNLYQFFYAAMTGALFSLIYCRTGKLRYTIALHMLLNFNGMILAPWIYSLTEKSGPFYPVIYGLYTFSLLGLMGVGVFFIIRQAIRTRPRKGSIHLIRPAISILCNPGTIGFLAICLYRFISALL